MRLTPFLDFEHGPIYTRAYRHSKQRAIFLLVESIGKTCAISPTVSLVLDVG
jgi:hypothetical protein